MGTRTLPTTTIALPILSYISMSSSLKKLNPIRNQGVKNSLIAQSVDCLKRVRMDLLTLIKNKLTRAHSQSVRAKLSNKESRSTISTHKMR